MYTSVQVGWAVLRGTTHIKTLRNAYIIISVYRRLKCQIANDERLCFSDYCGANIIIVFFRRRTTNRASGNNAFILTLFRAPSPLQNLVVVLYFFNAKLQFYVLQH